MSRKFLPVLTKLEPSKPHGIEQVPENEVEINPVGMLQELCMMRKWQPPKYGTSQEDGLPHQRLFTITCTAFNFTHQGIGRSKKLAKRQAAHKMVKTILTTPIEDDMSKQFDEEDEAACRASSIRGNRPSQNNRNRLVSYHKILKSLTGTEIDKLRAYNFEIPLLDSVKWLQKLSVEQEFNITFVTIDEISHSGKYQCLIQLCTTPVAVCHGTGSTTDAAAKDAALNALKYLQLLSK